MKQLLHLRPEAEKLRSRQLKYEVIGERLGITKKQAWCLCNWKRYKEMERKTNAKRAKAKRQHEKGRRAPCSECGRLRGPGTAAESKKGKGVCAKCRFSKEKKRTRQKYLTVQRLWKEGRSSREIAAEINTTPATISVLLSRMRKLGYSLPYRSSYPRQSPS